MRVAGLATGTRKLPNEAKVKLCGLRGLITITRKLPNEAKVKLCGLRGHTNSTRTLPNEAKVKLYELCELMTNRVKGKPPNEPDHALRSRFLRNEANLVLMCYRNQSNTRNHATENRDGRRSECDHSVTGMW